MLGTMGSHPGQGERKVSGQIVGEKGKKKKGQEAVKGVEGMFLLLLAMPRTAVVVPRGSSLGGCVSLKAVGGWSWGSAHSSMYNTAVLCLCLGYNKKAIKCEMS